MFKVTATDLSRLMNCPGSHLMSHKVPVVNQNTQTRDERVAVHWLVEQVKNGAITAEELIDRKAENGVYITNEMVEHLSSYLKHVADGHVEYEYTFNDWSWEISGRADHYKIEGDTLYVSDLKYGWSLVEPVRNWTLIAHAIGIITAEKLKIKNVVFSIFQPRPYHPEGANREWSITATGLEIYKQKIQENLSDLKDDLNTGSHCTTCPHRSACPAANGAEMNAIDMSEKAFDDVLDNATLSLKLDNLNRAFEMLKSQKKAYEEEALHRLKKGENLNNYYIDNVLGNKKWKKNVTPEYVTMLTGVNIEEKKLKTPAQAIKAGVSKEVVATLVERERSGLKLVRGDINSKMKKIFKPEMKEKLK